MQAKSDRNNGPFHWLEKRLWRSGVQDPTIREILVLAVQRHCLVPAFRRGALALSPGGGGVDLLVWLRSAALRMEFFCLNKICS